MNRLCTDIGWRSLNKYGEELCGDHVDIVEENENTTVVVLADGLGSGVKASILSTLTSSIISTMIASSMSIENCVSTIAETLPVCSVRGVAYSTFTIIRVVNGEEAELIQYDNPQVILLRNGKSVDYPMETLSIEGKTIFRSKLPIFEGDTFVAMSDGVVHAGVGNTMNFGWQRKDVIDYLETFSQVGFTAKTLTTILLEECSRLYGGEPGDDTTVCTVRIRGREPMNLLIGPPSKRDDCERMMSLFFCQGRQAYCLRRVHLRHRRGIPKKTPGSHPRLPGPEYSPHRHHQRRRSGHRRGHHHQPGAFLCPELYRRQRFLLRMELQARRGFPHRADAL